MICYQKCSNNTTPECWFILMTKGNEIKKIHTLKMKHIRNDLIDSWCIMQENISKSLSELFLIQTN